MYRFFLVGFLITTFNTSSVFANERYTDVKDLGELSSGEFFDMHLACQKGELVTGGYTLHQSSSSALRVAIVRNHPSSLTQWSVRIRNVDNASIWGQLQISIICTE